MSLPEIITNPEKRLLELMHSFSSRMWSSQWNYGFEFVLWRKMRECSEDLTLRELADLNFTCGLAGGWWMWDKNEDKEVFVEIEEWLLIFTKSGL